MLFMSDIILGEHNRSYDHTKDHMITSTKIVAVISTHCCVCDIIKLPWLCMALAIVDTLLFTMYIFSRGTNRAVSFKSDL